MSTCKKKEIEKKEKIATVTIATTAFTIFSFLLPH